jgi:hypothetical protein
MICQNFSNLNSLEKVMFIGELTHACMNDDHFKEMGDLIITHAKRKGMFENVTILPENKNIKNESDTEN